MGYGGLWQLRTGGEGTLSERREPERYDEAVKDRSGMIVNGVVRQFTMGKVLKGQEGSKAVGQDKATQSRPREVLFGEVWLGSHGSAWILAVRWGMI